MRRLLLISAGALLTLSACATVTEPAPSLTTPIAYGCAAGKRFTATYPAKGNTVVVAAGGLTKTLPLARSASGARYAAATFELWGKGDSARLSGFPGGPCNDCMAL